MFPKSSCNSEDVQQKRGFFANINHCLARLLFFLSRCICFCSLENLSIKHICVKVVIWPWKGPTQWRNAVASLITCMIPQIELPSSTANLEPTLSSVVLFSSSPAAALWSFSSIVLHLRHTQRSSLFTSVSVDVNYRYCRSIYNVPPLPVWVYRWNRRISFVTQSTDPFYQLLAVEMGLFCNLLLGVNLSTKNTFWKWFSNCGLSRIKDISST